MFWAAKIHSPLISKNRDDRFWAPSLTSRVPSLLLRVFAALAGVLVLILGYVHGVSEWKMRRTYEAPLRPLNAQAAPDLVAGRRMAEIIGCWAGCHGNQGEGGTSSIKGIHQSAAPTLSQVLPDYSDEELVRLVRYGVKRDGKSAIGMSSHTFWTLGDQDLVNIIAHLRAQPTQPPKPRKHEITFRGRLALATGEWAVSAEQVNRSIPRWGELPRSTAFERGRYLASIVCSECHGLDFRGNALEGGPSLAVLAVYQPAQFQHLLRTGKPIGERDIPAMSWMAKVAFTEQEIADLYTFLREYHNLGTAPDSASSKGSAK
ncbi:MAG TPA: c-type cytochrome [Casimicrobiaceae bacterium]|nr:c-type cytochrome [Casimicrobiaceae bacterium]